MAAIFGNVAASDKLLRISGKDTCDHGVDQHRGGLRTDAPACKVEDGLVVVGAGTCKGLTEQSQPPGERKNVRSHKATGEVATCRNRRHEE